VNAHELSGMSCGELLGRIHFGIVARITRNWSPHALPSLATTPVVSFSFDDFPRSAAQTGAEILAKFGVKGTYYVAGGRANAYVDGLQHFTADDLVHVARDGHEIGCHTFGHIRLPTSKRSEIEQDLLRNKTYVESVLGDYTMSSFAYPYGHVNIPTKAYLSRRFPICRGIELGINRGTIDLAQLRGVPLDETTRDMNAVRKWIDAAAAQNGWLIFFTHDIADEPSRYGCTPKQLTQILREVLARGIEILPVKDAAARMRV